MSKGNDLKVEANITAGNISEKAGEAPNNDIKESIGKSDELLVDVEEPTVTVNERVDQDQRELLRNSPANECTTALVNGTVSCDEGTNSEPASDLAEVSGEVNPSADTGTPRDSPKKSKSKSKRHRNRQNKRSNAENPMQTASDEYNLSVMRKQRIYYLATKRSSKSPTPGDDCEVFCANIPVNVLEDVLIPLFDRFGKIWNLRLQMSMQNRQHNAGFAFIRYTAAEAAQAAINSLNEYQIVPGKLLMVRRSLPNLSLFVGNIHRGLTKEQIHAKFDRLTSGLLNTIVKGSFYEEAKNSGFCILEYDSNTSAYRAKLTLRRVKVWGRQLFIDWSQQLSDTSSPEVQNSKTVFINCLSKGTTVESLTEQLSAFGEISTITVIKDYAFVKFTTHESATQVLNELSGKDLGSDETTITLARKHTSKFKRGARSQPMRWHLRRPRSYKQEESNATITTAEVPEATAAITTAELPEASAAATTAELPEANADNSKVDEDKPDEEPEEDDSAVEEVESEEESADENLAEEKTDDEVEVCDEDVLQEPAETEEEENGAEENEEKIADEETAAAEASDEDIFEEPTAQIELPDTEDRSVEPSETIEEIAAN